MEYNKITYNYIPNKHASLWTCLADLYKIKEDYRIIDNMSKAIRIYPLNMKSRVMRCSQEALVDKLENILKQDITAIIINDFEIEFDFMRDNIMPLISEYGASLFINNHIESDSEDKLILAFNDKILSCSEEKWTEIREQSYISIENFMSTESDDEEEDSYNDVTEYRYNAASLIDALSDLNIDKDINANDCLQPIIDNTYNRFENENIKESYSHTSNNETLTLSLTTDNDIIIDDGQESVKINNNKLNFFINTLKNLINI